MSSFTDQKQRIATLEDVSAPWKAVKGGKRFYCYLCGHQFKVGDEWRWVYGGKRQNLLVCGACDGEDVLDKWDKWWWEWEILKQGRLRLIADWIADAGLRDER